MPHIEIMKFCQNHWCLLFRFSNITFVLQSSRRCLSKLKADNLSAVLYSANDMRLEQRPVPEPEDNQVNNLLLYRVEQRPVPEPEDNQVNNLL